MHYCRSVQLGKGKNSFIEWGLSDLIMTGVHMLTFNLLKFLQLTCYSTDQTIEEQVS